MNIKYKILEMLKRINPQNIKSESDETVKEVWDFLINNLNLEYFDKDVNEKYAGRLKDNEEVNELLEDNCSIDNRRRDIGNNEFRVELISEDMLKLFERFFSNNILFLDKGELLVKGEFKDAYIVPRTFKELKELFETYPESILSFVSKLESLVKGNATIEELCVAEKLPSLDSAQIEKRNSSRGLLGLRLNYGYHEEENEYTHKLKLEGYRNPSLSLYKSMLCAFTSKLPYSMDIEQPEYVTGEFLNREPLDVDTNTWFRYEDRRNFFNSVFTWGDRKSAAMLQICFIFLFMLLGRIPFDFYAQYEDYEKLGINKLTNDEEFNQVFFILLSKLPEFCRLIESASNNEERRKGLDFVYGYMYDEISKIIGNSKRSTVVEGKRRISSETISSRLNSVVKMVTDEAPDRTVRFCDGSELPIAKEIREDNLEEYQRRKEAAQNSETGSIGAFKV